MEGPEPIVSTRGSVSKADVEHARDKTTALYKLAPKPVIHATLRLTHAPNRRNDRPYAAEATLDISGRTLRAHTAAATMGEATDLLSHRLRRQLQELQERSITRGRRPRVDKAQSHEWRHSDRAAADLARPAWYKRPQDERQLVRRKTFALHPMTPDEAAFDMEMLHHDFYLFTNIDTDEENVLARAPVGEGYELLQLRRQDETLGACAAPIEPRNVPTPEVDVDAAIAILDEEHEPFLFFLNAETGRGNVAYCRYDGHYGLIVPGDSSD